MHKSVFSNCIIMNSWFLLNILVSEDNVVGRGNACNLHSNYNNVQRKLFEGEVHLLSSLFARKQLKDLTPSILPKNVSDKDFNILPTKLTYLVSNNKHLFVPLIINKDSLFDQTLIRLL